jgi:murein DD-endopeptidase MepM/ murein hydrolase activator NlpD
MPRALVLVLAAVLPVVAGRAGGDPVTYRPPVPAPISDPFRPPASPYGPGNRGVEYDTAPGALVRAAAAGTVTFAGQVGGRLHVTVRHADGLRTTYGPLARIAPGLAAGDRVDAGESVGTAGEHLLWTARLGAAYVDPSVLVAASGGRRVRLVPDRRRLLGPR